MLHVLRLTFAVSLLIACGPRTAPPPPPPDPSLAPDAAPPAARVLPAPPALRLPATVRPLHYQVDLDIDPSQPTFTGHVVIALDITAATDVIWLHAVDLSIDAARLGDVAVQVIPTTTGFLGFLAPTALQPGPITLTVDYHGPIARVGSSGLFAQESGGDWYAYTQFEAVDARRAFPCFDEPSFKVPWQLTLHVPATAHALSNMPVESETTEKTTKTVTFQKSPPLPSYLVAFAIGPFELLDAGHAPSGAPIRVATLRGQSAEAAYPLEIVAPVVALFEDHLGSPYPYPKLDLVPIPRTSQFGAMENPGLITFRESRLLSPPADATLKYKRHLGSTLVHEVAHQWFGNLVTLAWWDDTWLNEALATWAENAIIMRWKPEWRYDVSSAADDQDAMRGDALESARRVREPIAGNDDIADAFDGITYNKGAAVLRMFEAYMGADKFRAGLRTYLAKYAHKNASYGDFVAVISSAAERDLSAPLSSFLEQTGVPLVTMELVCPPNAAKPELILTQQRYLPLGSSIDPSRTWQTPICVRWGAGKQDGTDCTLLDGARGKLPLTSPSCPDYIIPAARGVGYYHAALGGKLLDVLIDKRLAKLSAAERLALTGDVDALVAAGTLDAGRALALAGKLAADDERFVREWAIGTIAGVDELVADDQRANYQRLVRKLFGAQAKKLGFTARKGEPEDLTLLRPQILWLVGYHGQDASILEQATTLAWKWLDDHAALDAELVDDVLALAASRGDARLWERLHKDAAATTDVQERKRLLKALSGFRDPARVADNLALLASEAFRIEDAMILLWGATEHPGTRALAWAFVTERYDWLVARMPRDRVADLVEVGERFCTADLQTKLDAFFLTRSEQCLGGPRALAQAKERLSLCVAYRGAQAPAVAAYLKKQ